MNLSDLSPEALRELKTIKKQIKYTFGIIMKNSKGTADPLSAQKVAEDLVIDRIIKEYYEN